MALSNITIRDAESGFFLETKFVGFSYAVGTSNAGVVRLHPIDSVEGGVLDIDLATLTLQNESGGDSTPVGIEDRAALLNTYVSKKKITSGGGGGVSVRQEHIFANAAARDTYFTTNFAELTTGLQIVLTDNGAGSTVLQTWLGQSNLSSYPASPGTLWSTLQTLTAQEIATLYESISDVNRYNNVDKGKVDAITNTGRGQIITATEATQISNSINNATLSGQVITFTKNDNTTFTLTISSAPTGPTTILPNETRVVLQPLGSAWDASSGAFPSGSQAGFLYLISTAGTVDGEAFTTQDLLLSLVNNASTTTFAGNWARVNGDDSVHSWSGLTGVIDDTQIEAVLTRLGYQKATTGNETPSLHEFSVTTIPSRVDLNTDLNVAQTVSFSVTNFSRLNSLIVQADPVTPGTFITVATLTTPTSDGVQTQQATFSGLVTTTDRTINFRLLGTDTDSNEYTSNNYQVSVRDLNTSEFAYYGVRSTDDFATAPLNELTSVDVTASGTSYQISVSAANGEVLGIISPDNRDPISILDSLQQPSLDGFTPTLNVRTENSVAYNLLTLTNNSGITGTFNFTVTTE